MRQLFYALPIMMLLVSSGTVQASPYYYMKGIEGEILPGQPACYSWPYPEEQTLEIRGGCIARYFIPDGGMELPTPVAQGVAAASWEIHLTGHVGTICGSLKFWGAFEGEIQEFCSPNDVYFTVTGPALVHGTSWLYVQWFSGAYPDNGWYMYIHSILIVQVGRDVTPHICLDNCG